MTLDPDGSFQSWVERRIREAQERGEFDNLPGAGKPIPDLDRPYDDLWWIRRKVQQEKLSWLPPTLALRKEAQDALAAARRARSEPEVRQILERVNQKIRDANRKASSGPPLNLAPIDIERAVDTWRQHQAG